MGQQQAMIKQVWFYKTAILPPWELELSLLILLKWGHERVFHELCAFDRLALKMHHLALGCNPVMLSPRFTVANGLYGKNNNTGAYLVQKGCCLVSTVRRADKWLMVSEKRSRAMFTSEWEIGSSQKKKKERKSGLYTALYNGYSKTGIN